VTATLRIEPCDATSPEARALIERLDAELCTLYPEPGATHFRLDPEETAVGRGTFVVARDASEQSHTPGVLVACGAIRMLDARAAEVKRMFTLPSHRGRGLARRILAELETWALALGARRLALETGVRQHQAIALYERSGFIPIDPFGEYADSPLSLCMAKDLPG